MRQIPNAYGRCLSISSKLILGYFREHAGEPVSVPDILPLAIGDRVLSAREQEILRVTTHTAVNKLAKRGVVVRLPGDSRLVRWQLMKY